MRIADGCSVTLNYSVADRDGNLVDQGDEPLVYDHGDPDALFAKLQAALAGKQAGDTVVTILEPEDAFGDYDAELIKLEDLDRFEPGIKVGMMVEGVDEDGEPHPFIITDIADGKVVLDANHPFAGMSLVFTCTVVEVSAP